MKRIVLALTAAAVSLAGAGVLRATCSNASLDGTYGFYQWGYYGNSTSALGSGVGSFTFNGSGAIGDYFEELNNDGTLEYYYYEGSNGGSYTVSSNCDVTITPNSGNPPMHGTVTPAGSAQFSYMIYASGIYITGLGYKEQNSDCTTSNTSGTYGVILWGANGNPHPTAPASDWGYITLTSGTSQGTLSGELGEYGSTNPLSGTFTFVTTDSPCVMDARINVNDWIGPVIGNQIFLIEEEATYTTQVMVLNLE